MIDDLPPPSPSGHPRPSPAPSAPPIRSPCSGGRGWVGGGGGGAGAGSRPSGGEALLRNPFISPRSLPGATPSCSLGILCLSLTGPFLPSPRTPPPVPGLSVRERCAAGGGGTGGGGRPQYRAALSCRCWLRCPELFCYLLSFFFLSATDAAMCACSGFRRFHIAYQ